MQHVVTRDQTVSHKTKLKNESQKIQEKYKKNPKNSKVTNSSLQLAAPTSNPVSCLNLKPQPQIKHLHLNLNLNLKPQTSTSNQAPTALNLSLETSEKITI